MKQRMCVAPSTAPHPVVTLAHLVNQGTRVNLVDKGFQERKEKLDYREDLVILVQSVIKA